jgi:hypothetical protein
MGHGSRAAPRGTICRMITLVAAPIGDRRIQRDEGQRWCLGVAFCANGGTARERLRVLSLRASAKYRTVLRWSYVITETSIERSQQISAVPKHLRSVRATVRGGPALPGCRVEQEGPGHRRQKIVAMAPLAVERLSEIRNRALLLIGFAGAFRRSELVALDVEDGEEVPRGAPRHDPPQQDRSGRPGRRHRPPARCGGMLGGGVQGVEPPASPPDRCSGRSPRASDYEVRGSPIAASPKSRRLTLPCWVRCG